MKNTDTQFKNPIVILTVNSISAMSRKHLHNISSEFSIQNASCQDHFKNVSHRKSFLSQWDLFPPFMFLISKLSCIWDVGLSASSVHTCCILACGGRYCTFKATLASTRRLLSPRSSTLPDIDEQTVASRHSGVAFCTSHSFLDNSEIMFAIWSIFPTKQRWVEVTPDWKLFPQARDTRSTVLSHRLFSLHWLLVFKVSGHVLMHLTYKIKFNG